MPGRRWTSEEDAAVIADYRRVKTRELARRLNRSEAAIRLRAQNLGISDRTRPTPMIRFARWTREGALAEWERYKRSRKTVSRYCARKGYSRTAWTRGILRHVSEDEWTRTVAHVWPHPRWKRVGYELEHAAQEALEAVGYGVTRARMSRGESDLVATRRNGPPLSIQCKKHGFFANRSEWNHYWEFCEEVGRIPVFLARRGAELEWFLLLGPKHGAHWTPQPWRRTSPEELVRWNWTGHFDDPLAGLGVAG